MEIAPRIAVDPNVVHGAPVITGTRVPVSVVIGSLAGGMSKEEIETEYGISIEDIEAALAYAAELVARTEVTPLVGT
jgi:uncharacterized protein (DUF433 family)